MEVLVEIKRLLECFSVQEVGVCKVGAFVDGEVKEVYGGGR